MNDELIQGEIYLADFAPGGKRPVVVLSRKELNRGNAALVAYCTSAKFAIRSLLPNCVPLRAGEFGMRVDCVVQCENIFSIDRNLLELDRGPTGVLDPITLRAVVSAIGYVLDSNCELN